MKPGDLICVDGNLNFILEKLSFTQYCDKLDENMLEYDVDDAWERWQDEGPVYQVFDEDGKLGVVWEIEI